MAKEEKKAGTEIEVSGPVRTLSPLAEMDSWFEGFFPYGWMRPFHMQ